MAKHLKDSGVEVKEYTALLDDIKTLAAAHTKLWADPSKVCSSFTCLCCVTVIVCLCCVAVTVP